MSYRPNLPDTALAPPCPLQDVDSLVRLTMRGTICYVKTTLHTTKQRLAGRSHPAPLFWKLPHSTNCLEFIKTGKQADSRISNFIQQKFREKQFGHVGTLKTTITLFLNQITQSGDCSVLRVPHFMSLH